MSALNPAVETLSLEAAQAHFRDRHDSFLANRFEQEPEFGSLLAAMRYATLLGGKRVRPFLVYATGSMLGSSELTLDAPAAAIECVHAYSLVHDDLPAMDDDALRRGQPTCHIKFDEATAILAGDALQSLAFSLISEPIPGVAPERQLRMVAVLAEAAGLRGMCGGQMLDIAATGTTISATELEHVHRLKTGALLRASVMLGALTAPGIEEETLDALDDFAQAIGLAFQVQDDILDVTGDTQTLGKQQGADQALNKSTYPALLGLEGSKQRLSDLHQKALHALSRIPYNTALLNAFTDYLVTRDR
ncbi:(2E,6E)-farnesyl diphosphate synthase [Aliidiomarina sanyensis]|uniref:(2E,6E)-farnesyl diphosphate synthase n=1 Tax=Aliidiomarina sanyensis TaxID=1249555 RepID=A0A432WBI9_9GAMM|nr:(2E,6E)-farnesyl diphosphate synthase [Aliidiomarina sanyensis]RUO29118.1 (2E,6E)-farnesyl diphosphate synthase [Aliidiomarina sanyensis]